MRLDLSFDADIPRRRDVPTGSETSAAPSVPTLPESPLDRRLARLHETVRQSKPHDTPKSRNPQIDELPREGTRTREHRPRRTREGIAVDIRGIYLRQEERHLLAEAGRFRVLNLKDVASTIYRGDERAMRTDLDYLQQRGLVAVDSVAPRNDGHWLTQKRIEVVTLTKQGESVARESNNIPANQRLYHGLVKPREAEHDAQVYRAYLKEAERIERAGGTDLRVELDFELKSKVQKAIRAAQKADPQREMTDIKREVAAEHELPFVRDKIEIPDARIHYEMDQGGRTGHQDIEVVTAAYRPGHMRAKSQAGFRMYANASNHARLSKVEDEHHMLDWVMEL